MQIALWNHHTPYTRLLACALPEHLFMVLTTPHAPKWWRFDQREKPANVEFITEKQMELGNFIDLTIMQTAQDIRETYSVNPRRRLYLAHNRAEFEGASAVAFLAEAKCPMVAISPMKRDSLLQAAPFSQSIDVIPPYVNVEDYSGWTGEGGYILTVANNLSRPLFDLDAWLEATRGLPVKLVGEGNEGIAGSVGPAESWEQLKSLYRCAAVYLNPTVAPAESFHNLSLLEAMATGCPVVSWHPNAPMCVMQTVTNAGLRACIEHPRSEDVREIERDYGASGRKWVQEQFPLDRFRDAWLSVLERVTA